jgi:TolB protein
VFLALSGITVLCVVLLGAVIALGDKRTFSVVATTPDEEATVSVTLRAISITFSHEAHRDAVERSFTIDPPVAGVPRWRGRTFEWVLREPLEGGSYTVSLERGTLGRGSERMRHPFVFPFAVREPGLAMVEAVDGGERLVELREGSEPRELTRGSRIVDFAIAPDGGHIAAVVSTGQERSRLELIDVSTGQVNTVVDDPDIDIATVRWSADSQALLAVRRDALPDGNMGVPRSWLLRLSGEFVAPIDPEGEPSLSPHWSPDAQSIAYIAPATGRLAVMNLGTQEIQNLGQPRGGAFAWSPNSRKLAFEGVPAEDCGDPIQPVRVRSLDGEVDLVIGEAGESFSQPRFLNDEVVMSLRRGIGEGVAGTDLVFHSVDDAQLLRSIHLTAGTDMVLDWDIDPAQTTVVYSVQSGATLTTLLLDLESGSREVVTLAGRKVAWLP